MSDRLKRGVLVLAASALIVAARPAYAQAIDPAYRAEVMKLLDSTGGEKMGAQAARAAAEPLISALSTAGALSPAAVAIVRQTLNDTFERAFTEKGGLLDDIVAIYAKHLTIEDVREIAAFYQTELGKKISGVLPVVSQESNAAGQRWVAREMPAVLNDLEQRLRKGGYIK